MWPLDKPAREVLKLAGETSIAWAVFDPQWYHLNYPVVVDHLSGDEPAALLRHYFELGQRLGNAPNRFFDEDWHRRIYPQIATGVEAADYSSAFDAYCRRGSLDRSPHWLFDELGYRDWHPDVTQEALRVDGLANGYDHYLCRGSHEDRIGHILFDPAVYLANFDARDIPLVRRQGAFQHYLERLERGDPELPTSLYFDPAWYLQRYPEVAAAISLGEWKSALHHYLCNGTPTAFDPLESFSEAHYLAHDPGLHAVIAARHFRNGYMHFLGFGAHELRPPTAGIDLVQYAARPDVRSDLDKGVAPHAFAHWLRTERRRGLTTIRPESDQASEIAADPVLRDTATALLPLVGRFGYAFECGSEPIVSVVMVVRNGFAATLATLGSLRTNVAGDIELIVVDCGSTDELTAIRDYVSGVKVLRFESDVGWPQAANAGSQLATAALILFLTSDGRLAPGAVDHARFRLSLDQSIGAVGGMVLQSSGLIGQAGGILWSDGGICDYLRGASALSPEANFVRSVDFCSAAFLLVRASLLVQLEGFDHDCMASSHISADLCARIIQAGFQVIYDPSVILFHDGQNDDRKVEGEHFRRKHKTYLSEHFAPSDAIQVFARHTGAVPPRLLFIEDTVPLRRLGSGFVRSNDLVKIFASLGYQVTVYPVDGCSQNLARVYGDMPHTVEVVHDRGIDQFEEFVLGRIGYYGVIWVARIHNLERIRRHLSQVVGDEISRPLIILDTEAIAPLREAEQARLAGRPYDIDAETRAAFHVAADVCDAVIAVTPHEANTLQAIGLPRISVIGHMIEPSPTSRSYRQRAGLLFVGAIHTTDSPNLDSLIWFIEEVLPLIEDTLGWETRLTITGYTAPGIDLRRFEGHPRLMLRGMVANLKSLYDSHRVFIAPTRYASGIPYKVFEAASYGVPVVATNLLRRQLGWDYETEILSAGADDPKAFAAAVIALYRDEYLWQTIRDGALERLRRENGQPDYVDAVSRVLASPRRGSDGA